MNLSNIVKRLGKFTTDNSPTILTVIGVTGTLATALLSAKAAIQADRIIEDEQRGRHVPLTPREKVGLVWPHFIPPIGVGCFTIGCIIGANAIGTRRAAGLAAAFALSEKAFLEYRDKVVEKIGENKERDLRDELQQDRVTQSSNLGEMVVIGNGSVLCFEAFTGRYFLSDMETLRKAQNDINYDVNNNYYASLTDFYDLIGLPKTSNSDEVGWNVNSLLELRFSTVLSTDGRPCLAIDFVVSPIRGYNRLS